MKTLVIFEDSSDDPIEPLLSAVRESLARFPAAYAEVVSIPSFRVEEPSATLMKACSTVLATVQASEADRGALFMSSNIREHDGSPVFQGHIVLSSTKTHLLKLSLVEARGTKMSPMMQKFMRLALSEMANNFPIAEMTDTDRAWVKETILWVTQGINLATARLSTQTGNA